MPWWRSLEHADERWLQMRWKRKQRPRLRRIRGTSWKEREPRQSLEWICSCDELWEFCKCDWLLRRLTTWWRRLGWRRRGLSFDDGCCYRKLLDQSRQKSRPEKSGKVEVISFGCLKRDVDLAKQAEKLIVEGSERQEGSWLRLKERCLERTTYTE